MIKQLQRQLTAPFTIITGLILTLMIIGILVISARELNKKIPVSFQNQILDITSRLQFGTTISCTWLSRLKDDNRLIIYIRDNGKPLLYRGSWISASGWDTLIVWAREAVTSERIDPPSRPVFSSLLRNSVPTVTEDCNDTYLGSVFVLPTRIGLQSLTLLACKDPMGLGLYRQGILFFLLNLAGITALMSVSWVPVAKSLKPLAEGRKRQNEFIAAAFHELRAPPAVIRSSISAVRTAPDRREKFMDNVDRECFHASYLVDDMLLPVSVDTGHWSPRISSLDMDTLLISTYEQSEPLHQDRGVCLKLDLPETSLPRTCSNENRLEQIFAALLDSALRYTPRGRSVSLAASVQTNKYLPSCGRSTVCLIVSDQGRGMNDETKKHIFNRFYRGDGVRSHKQDYGLELSIVKELVQPHRGTINVLDSPDGSTCFLVRLPAEPEPYASDRQRFIASAQPVFL